MRVVWVNGCFDILHKGHIELFKYAKSLCDYLVVGVDEDKRVKASKGDSRPVNNLEDRIEVLESIKYIDKVVSFGTDLELETQIASSNASAIVIGSDYKDRKVIGSQLVKEIIFFNKLEGYSTTRLLESK